MCEREDCEVEVKREKTSEKNRELRSLEEDRRVLRESEESFKEVILPACLRPHSLFIVLLTAAAHPSFRLLVHRQLSPLV